MPGASCAGSVLRWFWRSSAWTASARVGFARAARTVELTIVNQRLVTNYMDTRGVIAEYDGQRYTLTLGSQGSHIIRDIICNDVLRIAPGRMPLAACRA